MGRPTLRSAISFINTHGALLVFPIKGSPAVPSLWKCFHPRTEMRWEWSSESGDQVPELWHLREELSRSRKVVYVKWLRGRATFFSLEVFTALLSLTARQNDPLDGLDRAAGQVYGTLLEDSPLPTKALRSLAGFEGRQQESDFQRALRGLWSRLLIVGYGEIEEGGFPSLAVGCSRLLFEDQWDAARLLDERKREETLARVFTPNSPFDKAYRRLINLLEHSAESIMDDSTGTSLK